MNQEKKSHKKETAKHRAAFEAWYSADRNFKKISENLRKSQNKIADSIQLVG